MTPEDLEEACLRNFKSRTDAAQILGISQPALSLYLGGKRPIAAPVEQLLRVLDLDEGAEIRRRLNSVADHVAPKWFEQQLERLFKDRAEASQVLGVSPGAISNYIKGRRPVSKPVSRLLGALVLDRSGRFLAHFRGMTPQ